MICSVAHNDTERPLEHRHKLSFVYVAVNSEAVAYLDVRYGPDKRDSEEILRTTAAAIGQ